MLWIRWFKIADLRKMSDRTNHSWERPHHIQPSYHPLNRSETFRNGSCSFFVVSMDSGLPGIITSPSGTVNQDGIYRFASAAGSLIYAITLTWPDIAYGMSILSRYVSDSDYIESDENCFDILKNHFIKASTISELPDISDILTPTRWAFHQTLQRVAFSRVFSTVNMWKGRRMEVGKLVHMVHISMRKWWLHVWSDRINICSADRGLLGISQAIPRRDYITLGRVIPPTCYAPLVSIRIQALHTHRLPSPMLWIFPALVFHLQCYQITLPVADRPRKHVLGIINSVRTTTHGRRNGKVKVDIPDYLLAEYC